MGRFQLTQIKLETQIKHDIELNLPYDAAYSADRDSSIEKEKRTYSRVVKDSIERFNEKRFAQLDTPVIQDPPAPTTAAPLAPTTLSHAPAAPAPSPIPSNEPTPAPLNKPTPALSNEPTPAPVCAPTPEKVGLTTEEVVRKQQELLDACTANWKLQDKKPASPTPSKDIQIPLSNRFEVLAVSGEESDIETDSSEAIKKAFCKRKRSIKKKKKVSTQCKQCDQSTCGEESDDLIIAPLHKHKPKPNHRSQNIVNHCPREPKPKVKDFESAAQWNHLQEEFPWNLQKIQPEIEKIGKENGGKYRIIAVVNGHFCVFQVDTGSFVSACSMGVAKKMGLQVFDVPEITARAATGPLVINKRALMPCDVGICRITVAVAVISDPSFSSDIILLGSSTIKALRMVLDFDTDTMYINSIFPVKMYTDCQQLQSKMREMKEDSNGPQGVEISLPADLTIPAGNSISVSVKLPERDARTLSGAYTYYTTDNHTNYGISSPDMLIHRSFPWYSAPIKIRLSNGSRFHRLIKKGIPFAMLRPLVSNDLEQKLGIENGMNPWDNEGKDLDPFLRQRQFISTRVRKNLRSNNCRNHADEHMISVLDENGEISGILRRDLHHNDSDRSEHQRSRLRQRSPSRTRDRSPIRPTATPTGTQNRTHTDTQQTQTQASQAAHNTQLVSSSTEEGEVSLEPTRPLTQNNNFTTPFERVQNDPTLIAPPDPQLPQQEPNPISATTNTQPTLGHDDDVHEQYPTKWVSKRALLVGTDPSL